MPKQVFAFGDGQTSAGQQQTVRVPTGATRLFLGIMDSYQHSSNWGGFKVTLAAAPKPPTPFSLDIKPGSDENPLNLKSKGVLPVSIVSTDEFDALSVDLETLLFGDPLLIDEGNTPVPRNCSVIRLKDAAIFWARDTGFDMAPCGAWLVP